MGLAASIVAAAALAVTPPAPGVGAAVTSYAPTFFAAASPTTALDMVQLLPGFVFDNGASVRGFGGAAGNVLIDGTRPASKDDGLDETLKRIPASSVLRIDVVRGGAPGIDMQGRAIIANVVRRTDRGGTLLVAASGTRAYDGRLLGTGRVEGSTHIGATSLEGSLLLSDGFDDLAGEGTRIRRAADGSVILKAREVNKGVGVADKLTGAVETPVLGGKLRVSGSLSSSPYDLKIYDQLSTPVGQEFEHFHQGQDVAELGVRYERPFGGKLTSETFLLQQFGRGNILDDFRADPSVAAVTGDDTSDLFNLWKTTSESIARGKLTYEGVKALSLEAGAEGDYNALTARTTFLQNGTPVALPAANVHVTELRGEGFGTATWTADPKITVEAGLRVEASRIASSGDVVSSQTFVYPKPRAALTWSPDAPDQIRLRVEREVGQLNFDDFAANSGNISTGDVHAGNPRLNPQTDWVFEAAYERHFWTGGDATLTLRHFALQDVIDRVPVVDASGEFDAPGNIGSGRKDELLFNLTLPTDRIGLKKGILTGEIILRNSRVIDPTTHLPRPISQLHPSYWEAHYTQGLPRLKMTWGFDALGQFTETNYRFNEIDTDKIKIYVSPFIEYKPRADLSFRAELRNAGGRGVEHTREVYNGPRDRSGPAFVDVRDLHTGRFIYLRIIKTFG